MSQNEDNQAIPIEKFLCHPHGKDKARKIVNSLAMAVEDEATRKEVFKLPIEPTKGLKKNDLVAADADGGVVFTINMKTGESYYE